MKKAQKDHWEQIFQNHIAILHDYGKLKMIDFKSPDSNACRIRFIFEEDYYRLHISGDLGELITTSYYDMTFEKFAEFLNERSNFKEKVQCSSRKYCYFSEEKAREDLENLFDDIDANEYLFINNGFSDEEGALDYLLRDFDEEKGLRNSALRRLTYLLHCEFSDLPMDIGRIKTGIYDIYLLAFKLAMDQLKKEELR